MSEALVVPGVPFALTPSPSSDWQIDAGTGAVTATAAPHSDIFIDPGSTGQINAETLLNAATLMGELPSGDFQFSAEVSVGFKASFDAGVLLLWLDQRHWAKLCFEFSPDREPMVVSVVAREVADDANAFVVNANTVWLRVSRIGCVYAYHASTDGSRWRLVRAFALESDGATPSIGLEVQSPTGDGCDVTFTRISLTSTTLADQRDGS